ncbi:hypothetical protein HO133_009011 [Letharia lupina]|uniref:Carrier domain-containing protein n=1 Tax=Letharia lupina TaxID=560253 RepID=A0A8H6FF83_9LECA|nr:uncharacterized protein HO133_009011 [Letharia lupina]KAF6226145.1 hypothetical protein HO133_009011 [Letharia lupina]
MSHGAFTAAIGAEVHASWYLVAAAASASDSEGTTAIVDPLAHLSRRGDSRNCREEGNTDAAKLMHVLGVDSLVAVGIRQWFRKEMEADVTVFVGFVRLLISSDGGDGKE